MKRPLVTVVTPYVPTYRVPFFRRLAEDLDTRGLGLTVAYGAPTGHVVRRADDVRLPTGVATPLSQWSLPLPGRVLVWHDLGDLARRSQVLVLDQALHQLEAYPLLAAPRAARRRGPALALWGHGRTYNAGAGPLLRRAKAALTRRADWFFAYTEAGGRQVAELGFPADRVTVVRNSTDTAALSAARSRVTEGRLSEFRARHGLAPGHTGLFIGGLDAAKRVPFLLAAAELTQRALPGFRLLVAGQGAQRHLVERAKRPGGPVVSLGPVTSDEDKALLGAAADLALLPGAVGLAAVDALTLATPVVTVTAAGHGPEFEYLEHGRTAVVVRDDSPRAYADAVLGLLGDSARLAGMRAACARDAKRYSVEEMSGRFSDGLVQMIDGGDRPPSRRGHCGA